jgi:hypothetical protein
VKHFTSDCAEWAQTLGSEEWYLADDRKSGGGAGACVDSPSRWGIGALES